MSELTNKKIISVFEKVHDEKVKAVLFHDGVDLCSLKFMRDHEKSFREILPTYFDEYISKYRGWYGTVSYADRESFMAYMCLETGEVNPDDFHTVVNFITAGIDLNTLEYYVPSSVDLFSKNFMKHPNLDQELLDFIHKNPNYLSYFLPLMCSIDNELFFQELVHTLQSAGLQDTLRICILVAMLKAKDKNMLLRFLDEIDHQNYYRFKALNEAAIRIGDYTTILTSKELVDVLRDAALGTYEKYFTADFKHAYHFINAYDRVHENEFYSFANELLNHGCDRARWALLNSLSIESLNHKYAKCIFSYPLSLEDLSFFLYEINGNELDEAVLPQAFETLFGILLKMDKVNYHFKTDNDITFARDISKAGIVSQLGIIATRMKDSSYIQRLDNIYDTLKEEAQAKYLDVVGKKTHLDVRLCAIRFLKTDNYAAIKFFDNQKIELSFEEALFVSDYLKTKKQSIKAKIIQHFLASKQCDKIMNYLLTCNEEYKQAAGIEMEKSRGKIDHQKINKKAEMFSWNKESVFTVDYPKDEIEKIIKDKKKFFLISPVKYKEVKNFFDTIKNFVKENCDYEYAVDYTEGLVSFGSYFMRMKGKEVWNNEFDAYPLGDQIKELIQSHFSQEQIAGILLLVHCVNCRNKKLYLAVCGKKFSDAEKNYDYAKELDKGYLEYTIVRQLEYAIAKHLIPEEMKFSVIATFAQEKVLQEYTSSSESLSYPGMYFKLLTEQDDIESLKKLIYLDCVFIYANVSDAFSIELIENAFEHDLISERLARYFLLKNGYWGGLFSPKSPQFIMSSEYKKIKFRDFLLRYINDALNIEFARGSLQTPYSNLLGRIDRFYGVEHYFKAIVSLRGLTWVRSPYGNEKNEILSTILKNIVKSKSDTYESFANYVEKYNITQQELMRATLFNPEFVEFTAQYLHIPYLKLAVFWFIAHLNESLYGDKQERRIEQIKEFSDISYPDFKEGAFDYNLYKEMIEKVPENILKQIYADAKYVTVGGLHKRAQRFFDAVNGHITKEECLTKIQTSRNKDYCLIYSLLPIEDQNDLYTRYTILAEFARQSKQFGAQRQLSERRTIDIAMDNLARAAGYVNSNIFIFEMESENPSSIFHSYEVEDIQIIPYIDEQKFKISYKVQKNEKQLASIPSKYSKNKTVLMLREQIKLLNQKLRRVIMSFETAMNTHIPFTLKQFHSMCREKIIFSVLNKLVLLANNKLCFYDGELKDIDGKLLSVDEIYIAHAVELKNRGLLTDAIEYVIQHNIHQPFKQVLREIYTKTELELTQDEVLRFRGFEVDVRKCVATLKGKGWGVSEDIGLRKVYYVSDTIAALFRECDFLFTGDFTDVNRELHGIFFLQRKTGEVIPIKDVNDITFSETLRDVDLMISISSKVIYDFELAMSTIEIRHEVLKSIIHILNLNNVSFLRDNIKVEGQFGTYLINVRTGLVFKEGKGNLALSTIYSIDKPILLNFLDEDPMTADIISKTVLLANDVAIKDASILHEIQD